MNKLIETQSLQTEAIEQLWHLVTAAGPLKTTGHAALSFQGSGTRTRTTFIQALSHLELTYIDLPDFLASSERARDLAGYLDPYYALYIIRFQDHDRMKSFAEASRRPVINAMSAMEHPCEALSDAYWFHTNVKPLDRAKIVIWGPNTNVLRSWTNIAIICGAGVERIEKASNALPQNVDLIVTDGWPQKYADRKSSLTKDHLTQMGRPVLLPTPPFTIGEELNFDPLTYDNFAGYEQKIYLLKVQIAIIRYVMGND